PPAAAGRHPAACQERPDYSRGATGTAPHPCGPTYLTDRCAAPLPASLQPAFPHAERPFCASRRADPKKWKRGKFFQISSFPFFNSFASEIFGSQPHLSAGAAKAAPFRFVLSPYRIN
ncbi:MAG: hypothetical protein ACI4UC_04885, partial [Alloprevotella sp.]